MFDSIYTGMSGLISYSKGLSGIGNNVANMNTPGFKGSDLEFLDLVDLDPLHAGQGRTDLVERGVVAELFHLLEAGRVGEERTDEEQGADEAAPA